MPLEHARVLLIGAGGLSCPAGTILARSGIGHITILDDDQIDESNLHRQTLYTSADVGAKKAEIAGKRLIEAADGQNHKLDFVAREMRLLPGNAEETVRGYDVVVEGADNFATKFLAADACALAGVPLVQAGVVRWVGWAFASIPGASACLRCVFEDIPRDRPETCADAGVVGPAVGVVASLQAALALRVLLGDDRAAGELWSYRALAGTLRRNHVARRGDCALCAGTIRDTKLERYAPPSCAA